MTAGSGLLLGISVLAGTGFGWWALAVVPSALAVLELVQRRLRWRLVVIAVLGVVLGSARAGLAPEPVSMADLATSRAADGIVATMPIASGGPERTIVRIDRIQDAAGTWSDREGRVLVYLPSSGPPVNLGDRVYLLWNATPKDQLPPGYAGYLDSQGVSGSAQVWFVRIEQRSAGWMRHLTGARRAITGLLHRAIPGDAGALAAGIVTGDDSALSDEARLWFRRTGTTHITAVSGQNVALLIGFLAIWFPPRNRSTRWLAHGVMLIVVWLYVGMVGLEAPALRAAIMATLMMLGSWFGRRPEPVTILALTLGGMALLDPGMVQQVGFLLSAAASWALCSSMPTRGQPTILRGLVDMFKAVMAANIATLPILLWTFGEWSPISLLANLLIGPIMTVAFPASYILVAIGFPFPGLLPWLAWIPAIPLDFSIVVVHRLSTVLPLLHLPVAGPGMTMLVALPCFAALSLMSPDGERWLWRIVHAWKAPDRIGRHVLGGLAAGGTLAMAGILVFWR